MARGQRARVLRGQRNTSTGRRAPTAGALDQRRQEAIAFSVAKVRKPLFSVSKSIDLGNRIVFDADGSYIEDKANGEQTVIDRENGVFTMKFWVVPKPVDDGQAVRQLAPFGQGGASGSQDRPPVWRVQP